MSAPKSVTFQQLKTECFCTVQVLLIRLSAGVWTDLNEKPRGRHNYHFFWALEEADRLRLMWLSSLFSITWASSDRQPVMYPCVFQRSGCLWPRLLLLISAAAFVPRPPLPSVNAVRSPPEILTPDAWFFAHFLGGSSFSFFYFFPSFLFISQPAHRVVLHRAPLNSSDGYS